MVNAGQLQNRTSKSAKELKELFGRYEESRITRELIRRFSNARRMIPFARQQSTALERQGFPGVRKHGCKDGAIDRDSG